MVWTIKAQIQLMWELLVVGFAKKAAGKEDWSNELGEQATLGHVIQSSSN